MFPPSEGSLTASLRDEQEGEQLSPLQKQAVSEIRQYPHHFAAKLTEERCPRSISRGHMDMNPGPKTG